jgi:peptide/nickel transport system substrate-binding protein
VIIATGADAGDLLPPLSVDATGRLVSDQIFDHLADIGDNLSTVGDKGFTPRLARSWHWAPDSLSIVLSLDPRANWHDGAPVRANDVVFSFKLYTDPALASPIAPLLANVDSVTARDSLTVVAWFKHHTPEEFYDLAYQFCVMPAHVYDTIPAARLRTSDAARHPVGSGRFKLVRWDAGSRIELVSDTANYHGRAKVDRVVIVMAQDPNAAATQVLTGQSDFYEAFPVARASALDSSATAVGAPFTQMAYAFMAMNLKAPGSSTAPHPIFGDLAVRRAMSMALDRRAMLQNVFGKYGRLGYGPFPMVVPTADSTLPLPPYDVAAANALLDSAGWHAATAGAIRVKNGHPLQFRLMVPNSSAARMRYAVLVQDQLRKVGADVTLEPVDFGVTLQRQSAGNFDAVLAGNSVDPSITGVVQQWGTAGIGPHGQNVTRYSNPTVDALLDSASHAFDPDRARGFARRAYEQIIKDAPAVWLYDVTTLTATNRRIHSAPMRADAWWTHLADWSIPPDRRIARDRVGLAPAGH